MSFTQAEREAAQAMLWEMEREHLIVTLAPAPFGERMIRVVECRNPEWYRELCREFSPSRRRRPRVRKDKYTDTFIKRREVLKTLRAITRGEDPKSIYTERLKPYIEDCCKSLELAFGGYELQGVF